MAKEQRKQKSGGVPKPVFSPSVPADARKLLSKSPKLLVPADAPAPPARSDLRNSPGESVAAIVFFAGLEIGAWFLARWIFYGLLPDAVAVWLTGGAGAFLALLLLGAGIGVFLESDDRAAARKYHGQYLTPVDWDEEATVLMLRAQQAVRVVKKSAVNKQGLLDAVKNDVVLPEQLWDLGRILQQQSVLRTRQAEIGKDLEESQLDQILGPQRVALKLSAQAMETRVVKLETYADQVRAADAVLRAEAAASIAAADTDRYVELLASTDALDQTDLIEELTRESADVHSRLTRSLAAALETGQTLSLPATPDSGPSSDSGSG